MKGEWIPWLIQLIPLAQLIPWPLLASLALLVSSLDFPSFELQGHDLGRIESWLALLCLSACGGNFRADRDFLLACGLRKTVLI